MISAVALALRASCCQLIQLYSGRNGQR